MRSSLDVLVASLVAIDVSRAPSSAIAGLLRTARIEDAALAPYVQFSSGTYTRKCVYRDTSFELLVLCWSANAHSPIHDHGASRCFVQIQRGSLSVDNYALDTGGRSPGPARLALRQRETFNAGDIDASNPARDIHRVAAPGGDAISLHLYARPLDRCLVFDLARETCNFAVNRYSSGPPRNDRE